MCIDGREEILRSKAWQLQSAHMEKLKVKEDEDMNRQEESFEEDPELTFRVDELNLLGILYCKCEP